MLRTSQPRIISFVRLLGKPGIFRPLPEYCASRVDHSLPETVPSTELTAPALASGAEAKIPKTGFSLRGRIDVLGTWGSCQLPTPGLQVSVFS
jgi:hypothetical protein